MNRNVESHFAELPSAQIERSIFDRSSTHKTSFDAGRLIPFYIDEVLPGDTFNVSTSLVARLQTLITPIMDNVYLDTYYFFVPSRLCWTHWKEFMGENSDSAWIPEVTYPMPKISSPENGWNVGTIADYFGIPVGVEFNDGEGFDGLMPDALPFRAYALICQEWFRDQNLTDPLNIPLGDSDQTGSNGDSYINDVANGGKPFKVSKYHDYFTSCLPTPQKGPSVSFTFEGSASYQLPLVPGLENVTGFPVSYSPAPLYDPQESGLLNPLIFFGSTGPNVNGMPGDDPANGYNYTVFGRSASDTDIVRYQARGTTGNSSTNPVFAAASTDSQKKLENKLTNAYLDMSALQSQFDSGVIDSFGFSINELRLAFQLQKFYEKQARAGSRYRETILEMFGVHSPDARMMIPEYLGGTRVPIEIHQITNQSQGESDFLGDLGAMSNTADVHDDFVKSFTEHGYVLGVCCLRYDHSYPQGLNRMFVHDSYLDYYWPVFANIGEQPVYKYEIDATIRADESPRKNVFGYQEAWANYRFKPARVSGEMRPGISNSLASWHLADYYTAQPALSDSWIREDASNIDRVLAVTSSVSNQCFVDFYIKNTCTRAMPMYSIPGLIDHH